MDYFVVAKLTSLSTLLASRLLPDSSSVGSRLCRAFDGACRVHGFPCRGPGFVCWFSTAPHRRWNPDRNEPTVKQRTVTAPKATTIQGPVLQSRMNSFPQPFGQQTTRFRSQPNQKACPGSKHSKVNFEWKRLIFRRKAGVQVLTQSRISPVMLWKTQARLLQW